MNGHSRTTRPSAQRHFGVLACSATYGLVAVERLVRCPPGLRSKLITLTGTSDATARPPLADAIAQRALECVAAALEINCLHVCASPAGIVSRTSPARRPGVIDPGNRHRRRGVAIVNHAQQAHLASIATRVEEGNPCSMRPRRLVARGRACSSGSRQWCGCRTLPRCPDQRSTRAASRRAWANPRRSGSPFAALPRCRSPELKWTVCLAFSASVTGPGPRAAIVHRHNLRFARPGDCG